MEKLRIETNGDEIAVFTPYNKQFVDGVKRMGSAKWNPNSKCWTMPCEYIENIRKIMEDTFGYSDISTNETIKLRIKFLDDEFASQESVDVFGKRVAVAYGRDSGAKVGEDVILESGEISSGGSARYWTSKVSEGSIFYLFNVNKNLFLKEKDNLPYNIKILEVIEEECGNKRLIEEKERLLARIEEINRILQGENQRGDEC